MRDESVGASIILDGVYPIGRGLEAWVELRIDGQDLPLAAGRQDLTVPAATSPFLRQLGDAPTKITWADGLRTVFYEAVQADKQSATTTDLADVEPRGLQFVVDPIIEAGGHTRLIAPGGSGKSLFALAVALTVVTGSHKFLGLRPGVVGPVLYLDWETDEWTHAQRISALCAPHGLELERGQIWYRNQRAPLARSIQADARAARTAGAVMLVVDSAKMAAGPSGQSSGEEATLGLYTALRELALPALIIDHKAKEDIAKGRRGGYGSVYMENLARMQWEFMHHNPTTRRFVLELTKENNVGARPAIGFQLNTTRDDSGTLSAASFTQVNPDVIRTQDDEGVGDRIDSLFITSTEPMPVSRIAELTGIPESGVRAYLNRSKGRYFNVNEGRKGITGLWRPKEEYLSGPTDDGIQDSLEDAPISDFREGVEVY